MMSMCVASEFLFELDVPPELHLLRLAVDPVQGEDVSLRLEEGQDLEERRGKLWL